MEEMHWARYSESTQGHSPIDISMFTSPETVQTLSFWGFMETSLHRHD